MTLLMLNRVTSENMSCVVEQLRARGSRHHLLGPVASALGHISLLRQLPVGLLPAPASGAHVVLLREDPTGRTRGGEAGELDLWAPCDLQLYFPVLTMPCVCCCLQVTDINRSSAEQREGRILLMVVSMVTGYLLCWMPYGVVAMLSSFGRPGMLPPTASLIPALLAKASTVLNPFIYVLLNKQVTAAQCKYSMCPSRKPHRPHQLMTLCGCRGRCCSVKVT